MPLMTMMMGGGMNMMNWGWNSTMPFFGGGLLMILWWVFIIAGIVALVKWIMNQGKPQRGMSVLDILKERYAKGEISKQEFEDKKKDIL